MQFIECYTGVDLSVGDCVLYSQKTGLQFQLDIRNKIV